MEQSSRDRLAHLGSARLGGLAMETVIGQQRGIVELPAKITGTRRSPIPLEGGDHVLRAAPAFLAAATQQIHCPGVTLARSAQIPELRLRSVLLNAAPIEEHI